MQDDLLGCARDAGYTAVGFAVLAFQRAQVRRRQLMKSMLSNRTDARRTARSVARRIDRTVDPMLDGVERVLPGQVRSMFRSARLVGKTVENTLLG